MPLDPVALAMLRGANIGHLATLMADGSPQVTPVWVDTDGQQVLINTAAGRLKWRNVRRDGRVAVDVTDRAEPERWVTLRGRVVELRTEGAAEHADRLAKKYTGRDRFSGTAGEQRVIVVIRPERVAHN